MLGRGIFQGQHHLNGLLESTDAQLKEDLALLVMITLYGVYALVCVVVVLVVSYILRDGVTTVFPLKTLVYPELHGSLYPPPIGARVLPSPPGFAWRVNRCRWICGRI